MRTVFLLLMAMLVIKTTSAQGQEACSRAYTACADKCVSRPSQSLQDNCFEACQSQNNACFAKIYGNPGSSSQTVQQEPAAPRDAQAQQQPAHGQPAEVEAAEEPREAAKPAPRSTRTAKPSGKPAERRAQ